MGWCYRLTFSLIAAIVAFVIAATFHSPRCMRNAFVAASGVHVDTARNPGQQCGIVLYNEEAGREGLGLMSGSGESSKYQLNRESFNLPCLLRHRLSGHCQHQQKRTKILSRPPHHQSWHGSSMISLVGGSSRLCREMLVDRVGTKGRIHTYSIVHLVSVVVLTNKWCFLSICLPCPIGM
jgi:hypothetical protein